MDDGDSYEMARCAVCSWPLDQCECKRLDDTPINTMHDGVWKPLIYEAIRFTYENKALVLIVSEDVTDGRFTTVGLPYGVAQPAAFSLGDFAAVADAREACRSHGVSWLKACATMTPSNSEEKS